MHFGIYIRDAAIMIISCIAATLVGILTFLVFSAFAPEQMRDDGLIGVLILGTVIFLALWLTRAIAARFGFRCPQCKELMSVHSNNRAIRISTATRRCSSCGNLIL
jgi:hypothetical protein